jgi:hypothetical protein
LPALGVCFRFDQIRETFDFSEIHLAIFKPSPRKLSWLCEAATLKPSQRIEKRSNDSPASMNLELHDVFACFAVWRSEPKHQCAIDSFSS